MKYDVLMNTSNFELKNIYKCIYRIMEFCYIKFNNINVFTIGYDWKYR